jgi:NAD-dependent deacetylase
MWPIACEHGGRVGHNDVVRNAEITIADMGDPAAEQVAEMVASARRITVITGAGVSTDSGIPDFRGPNGLWTKNPAAEKTATIDYYIGDPEVRRVAWEGRVANLGRRRPEPNLGHRTLFRLEEQDRLRALVTQNVDGLHLDVGHSPDKVIEVHGSWRETVCWTCSDRRPMSEAVQRVQDGEPDPPCLLCGGILKSATILFGESLVPHVIQAAMDAAEDCDLLLAVGTTLAVGPANNVVPRARNAGAKVVILNGEPTSMDRYAHALVVGSIGEWLPRLIPAV